MALTHQEIIENDSDKSVVIASAASGKTHLLTEKVRKILKENYDPTHIVVITFTNLAANEMKKRLGADYKEGMFIGTIHGFANHCLTSAGIETRTLIDNGEFDALFPLIKKYQYCIPIIDWVFLDEAQDSDELQFDFIFNLIKPTHFFVVGDYRQSIYQFKNSNPSLMLELATEPDVVTFNLGTNYRNDKEILDFARTIAERNNFLDSSKCMTKKKGQVIKVKYDADTLLDGIKQVGEWGSWFLLCRTNAQCSRLYNICITKEIPAEMFSKADFDSMDEITEKLTTNTVKIMTIHQAKGLESDKVVVVGANYRNAEEVCISYVAATRAKHLLIWTMPNGKKKKKPAVNSWEK